MTNAQRLTVPNQRIPISEKMCTFYKGTWETFPAVNTLANYSQVTAPDCVLGQVHRDNHLGNVAATDAAGNPVAGYPEAERYQFTVPAWMANKECVIRLRYNMSSADYPQITAFNQGRVFNSSYNCPAVTVTSSTGNVDDQEYGANSQCMNVLNAFNTPLYNRPSVKVDKSVNIKLALAFNTNQIGRTFQDRSYLLKFFAPPAEVANSRVFNLNFRGRRGNIVQCYPAVENDFIPDKLAVTTKDYVHIQFCGSDFNPNNNPNNGEGWRFSTRTNMIEMKEPTMDGVLYNGPQSNFPKTATTQTLFKDYETFKRAAFVDQDPTKCGDYEGKNNNNDNNAIDNCNKLNMAKANFDLGLVQFNARDTAYNYMSTRNNNFSNRSMKGMLWVSNPDAGLTPAQTTGVVIAVIAAFGLVGFFGARAYAKRNPSSKIAATYDKITSGARDTAAKIRGVETTSTTSGL